MNKQKNKDEEMSQAGFARLCGVSSEAVRKAIVAGKVDARSEGRSKIILLSGQNSVAYLHDKNAQRKKTITSKPSDLSEINKYQKKSIPPVSSKENQNGHSSTFKNIIDLTAENIDINSISLADVNKIKGIESARKSAQDRNIARGDLIDRKIVTTVFGKIYTIEVNELKPIADKTPSKIAAIFGDEDSKKILKVNQLLSSEITKVLKHINYEVDRFLKDINKTSDDLIYADG